MKRRGQWIIAVALALTLLAAVWFASRRQSVSIPSPHSESTASIAAHAKTAPSQPASAVAQPSTESQQQGASYELPDWQVPLEEAVPLLVKYADAGDMSAAFELSIRLSACTEHALREARASDQRDLELMEEDKNNERLTDELRAVRNKNSQFRLDQNAGNRRGCEKVPAELRAHWLDGIDRAARSGNVWAKLQYGQLAIADYNSVAAIVANVDEVIARRDKARAYLFEALQSGDPRSLRALADGYAAGSDSTPRLFAPDASKAYAYMYAGMLAGTYQQSVLDWMIANGSVPLTAAQMASAEVEGRRIYEQCCKKH